MPTPISTALGTTHAALLATGAFDGFIDVDSQLHIDPALLKATVVPELSGSYATFQDHFANVVRLLVLSTSRTDALYREANRRLTFTELPQTGLGYAKDTTQGSAIGTGLAAKLTALAADIVAAGVQDPTIFELVSLLQEGIGADRISDMTASTILPDLLTFTQRVCKQLGVNTHSGIVRGKSYDLPHVGNPPHTLVLIPRDILDDLPVANSWDDIDKVVAHNDALRASVSLIIGETWRSATKTVSKSVLRNVLLNNPDLIADLVALYKKKTATPYDFTKDPAGQGLWYWSALQLAKSDPLDLTTLAPVSNANIVQVVDTICQRFKTLIQNNRLYEVLYNDDGTIRPERVSQLTFYALADQYCEANDIDLSAESNAGRGPVDFKMSKGYSSRVNVEVKLSSNSRLVHGFTTQLPIYDAAEKSIHSILLVIRVNESLTAINTILDLRNAALKDGKRVPDIVIIDGRKQASASKATG
jgi:hypothetical protein